MDEGVERGVRLRAAELGDESGACRGVVDRSEQPDRVVASRFPHGRILDDGHQWQERRAEIGLRSTSHVGRPSGEAIGVVAERRVGERRPHRRHHPPVPERRQASHAARRVGQLTRTGQRQQCRARCVAERFQGRRRLGRRAIDWWHTTRRGRAPLAAPSRGQG